MSDTVDLTLLAGQVQELARDVRLMRLQLDNLASRLTGQDGRLSGIESRIATIEQSFHELVAEVARGFGQMQQQATRQEKRIEALDAGLAAVRTEITESTDRILRAIASFSR